MVYGVNHPEVTKCASNTYPCRSSPRRRAFFQFQDHAQIDRARRSGTVQMDPVERSCCRVGSRRAIGQIAGLRNGYSLSRYWQSLGLGGHWFQTRIDLVLLLVQWHANKSTIAQPLRPEYCWISTDRQVADVVLRNCSRTHHRGLTSTCLPPEQSLLAHSSRT